MVSFDVALDAVDLYGETLRGGKILSSLIFLVSSSCSHLKAIKCLFGEGGI